MTKKPIFEPVCQIRPKGLIIFNQLANRADFATPETKFEHGKTRKVYTGEVTQGAKKRIKKAIQTLVAISNTQEVHHPEWTYPIKFRLTFITLTLPSDQGSISDKEFINQLLPKFLRECSRKDNLKHYIWKAERQKNGNIHFHITTNVFIHYQVVQDRWNNVLRSTNLINEFKQKHGHTNPHSTEIKAVRNINQIERYLQKYYMKKNQYDEIIEGKIWDCSLSLKSVPWPRMTITNQLFDHLNSIIPLVDEQVIEMDKCSIVWFHEWQRKALLNDSMSIIFNEFLNAVRNYSRVPRHLTTSA
ncbi:MAG: rolling circle replication-associated protein [Shewanella sp.]